MMIKKSESYLININARAFRSGIFCSVESHDLIGQLVHAAGQALTGLAGDVDDTQGRTLAEVLCPLGVMGLAIAPHGLQSRIRLGRLVQPGKDGGDAEEHEQLMLHVLLVLAAAELVQVHGFEAGLGDLDVVGVASAGDIVLDGLALPADGVAVQVGVHVEHPLHEGQGAANHQVVLIKDLPGQLAAAHSHDFRAEGAGVDGQHLVDPETLGVTPAKDAALGQHIGVVDGAVTDAVGMDIVVVGHKQVHAALPVAQLQPVQEADKIGTDFVVGVHDLEIFAGGSLQAGVDAGTMTAVLLVDDLDDVGILGPASRYP